MDELLETGARALRKAALTVGAKEYILGNDKLFKLLKKAADRYIGGETLAETVNKVIAQNEAGIKCSIEFMGEATTSPTEVATARAEFLKVIQEINRLDLHSTVSLDLSHIGLAISQSLCLENLDAICAEASKHNIEVMISAEGIERTDEVLDAYMIVQKDHKNVGITLQAYLHRTKDDFSDIINSTGRIRIVKGAFQALPGYCLPRGNALDEAYLGYVEQLLAGRHLCSIATHHDKIQQAAKQLIDKFAPSNDLYEFESLYGIAGEQLDALKEQGYPVKRYFVYGTEWYLYLCNRIAEYPMNIFRALDDMV